ncbi:MAG TPA: homoserine kinase [Acidimicrobiia bacterium]|nr:homoserine kinase [Acidimicrobiia bacterium]
MNEASASAPATTANLGPGFDCVALALAPRCVVTARRAGDWSVVHTGTQSPDEDEADAVMAAAKEAIGDLPLALSVDNHVPLGRGIGSSAAAFVAGAAAALRAVGEDASPDRVFRIAAKLEGHADQAAAAVYGGLVLVPAEGMPMRLPIHPSLRPVVAVPDTRLPTHEAREVLPDSYPRDVVVRTVARVAALTAGLISGDPGMLAAAHGDEIHEVPRAPLSPEVGELIAMARRAGALHAARSGAGPSVLAIATVEKADRVAAAFESWGAMVLSGPVEATGLI